MRGRSPTNEEDSLAVCARLVRRLNVEGADWSDPMEGVQDVDGYSTHLKREGKKLQMQVVRAGSNDEMMWRQLNREVSSRST